MTDGSRHFVYVVDGNDTVERRQVTLGDLVSKRQIILSGLRPGERVVVGGLNKVAPGAKVAPVVAGE